MATDKLGLYVHIPYCVRKCNYCDFCSLTNGRSQIPEEYISALCSEILSYGSERKRTLDTVYFGGGTPSLLSVGQMTRIFDSIRQAFDISHSAEITLEANPGTLTFDKAVGFKNIGFNRVSIGLQSIHEKEMKKLGRIHNYRDFVNAFTILRDVGFDNINVDLMYGIPYQTKESFEETLRTVLALGPDHISSYGLIVEEGTPFFSDPDLHLPTLDEECDMYELCCKILSSYGYEHYEISNYAKEGKRSRHNLIYWNFAEYIGVGASAHSFLCDERFYNTSDVSEYISGFLNHVCEEDAKEYDASFEYAMLKLRLKDGLDLFDYKKRFNRSFAERKSEIIKKLAEEGLVNVSDRNVSLTEKGFYLSNSILAEIL